MKKMKTRERETTVVNVLTLEDVVDLLALREMDDVKDATVFLTESGVLSCGGTFFLISSRLDGDDDSCAEIGAVVVLFTLRSNPWVSFSMSWLGESW